MSNLQKNCTCIANTYIHQVKEQSGYGILEPQKRSVFFLFKDSYMVFQFYAGPTDEVITVWYESSFFQLFLFSNVALLLGFNSSD